MSILQRIKEKKREFEQKRHLSRVNKVAELKKESMRMEEHAKVVREEKKEKLKIQDAKKEVFEGSHPVIAAAAKNIKDSMEKKKKELKKSKNAFTKESKSVFDAKSKNNPWK